MSAFTKTDKGLILFLDEAEVVVLRNVATEILSVIASHESASHHDDPLARLVGISTNDNLPENPVLARLFPDAYKDKQRAGEFRRYTETSLYATKREAIVGLVASLPSSGDATIELDSVGIDQWMRALNDLRLALGVILEVDENSDERFSKMNENDPEFFTLHVFYWLGWLLENVIDNAVY